MISSNATRYQELTPRYAIPLSLFGLALLLLWIQTWLGIAIALLALFLGFQTATIRLRFTDTALEVYRGNNCIRQFPYDDWIHWEIFWPGIPILFYFREVNSIHFLPILFNTAELLSCLEEHCPSDAP